MRIILLGSPGAGKDTQALKLSQRYSIPLISTGEMLRNAIQAGTSLGLSIKNNMGKGELISDDIVIDLVKQRIANPDCSGGFLLDGFPRTIRQAEALSKSNIQIDYVIEIAVDDEEIVKRLSGRWVHAPSGRVYHTEYNPPKKPGFDDITNESLVQREDDKKETVLARLKVYREKTRPLINYYRKMQGMANAPRYVCVDGNGGVEKVANNIMQAIMGT
jgi:adenylate kinase